MRDPDGHFKIPHLWPDQNPPGDSRRIAYQQSVQRSKLIPFSSRSFLPVFGQPDGCHLEAVAPSFSINRQNLLIPLSARSNPWTGQIRDGGHAAAKNSRQDTPGSTISCRPLSYVPPFRHRSTSSPPMDCPRPGSGFHSLSGTGREVLPRTPDCVVRFSAGDFAQEKPSFVSRSPLLICLASTTGSRNCR
jgi:hypothetical protein